MAHTNESVTGIRTVFLPTSARWSFVSSRFVREIAQYGGDVRHLVPAPVARRLAELPGHTSRDRRSSHELRRRTTPSTTTSTTRPTTPATPAPSAPPPMDSETLLRRAIDIMATAPTFPLSSSPRIDRDEIIELLEESVNRLPDELRQARWMLKERQEFVAKTRREADEILDAARVQAERMVQRTEVVRAAEQRARQVMEAADTDARRLRHETEDFLDQRLASFEILLDKLTRTVSAGRERLDIGVAREDEPENVEDDDDPTQRLLRPGPRLTRGGLGRPTGAPVALDGMNPLLINAAELLRRPGKEKDVRVTLDCRRAGRRRRADRCRRRRRDPRPPRGAERRHRRDGHGRRRRGTTPAGAASPTSTAQSSSSCTSSTSERVHRSTMPSRSSATRSISPRWPANWCSSSCRWPPLCRPDCAGLCPSAASTATSSSAAATPPVRRPLVGPRRAEATSSGSRPRDAACLRCLMRG